MACLDKVSKMCLGCGLCSSALGAENVELSLNKSGHYQPLFKSQDDRTNKFISSYCPVVDVTVIQDPEQKMQHDSIWGGFLSIKTGYANDEFLRNNGSSGGVLTSLAVTLLKEKKVDFVIGSKATEDNPFLVETVAIKNPQDIKKLAGSRYAPSSPLASIDQLLLDNNGVGLFIGKPCDVTAFKRYTNKFYPKRKFITFSFFCAGTPSLVGTFNILDKLGINKEDVSTFRYRGDGWPGFAKATTHDGHEFKMDYETSWQKMLSPAVLWRCRICPDGVGESADIVCADAWNIVNGKVSFNEDKGRSFILTRSEIGESILLDAIVKNIITINSINEPKDITSVQYHQWYRKSTILYRYVGAFLAGSIAPTFSFKNVITSAFKISMYKGIRTGFGTFLRARKRR